MTVQELTKRQEEIANEICAIAKNKGLVNENVEPIYDGLGVSEKAGLTGVERYLSSKLKVAWVLKEPYDDKTNEGLPWGGGFSIPDDGFIASGCGYNIPTWRRIAYSMYQFFTNTSDWNQTRYCVDVLRSIAWVNLSKMPHYSKSHDGNYQSQFKTVWHDIVLKQLKAYEPDVIVFGNVFNLFLDDERENPFKSAEKDESFSKQIEEKTGVACHYWRLGEKQRIIHPYHPGIPCLRDVQGLEQRYCEGIYLALMKAAEELGD